MDKKSKIFFLVLLLLVIGVTVLSYLRYFVFRDYDIIVEDECDPEGERCFVRTGEGDKPVYYKRIIKKAHLIEMCDPKDESCNALDCIEGQDCRVEYCREDDVSEDEKCADPNAFGGISSIYSEEP